MPILTYHAGYANPVFRNARNVAGWFTRAETSGVGTEMGVSAAPTSEVQGSTSVTLTITGTGTNFTTPSQFSLEGAGGSGGAPAGSSIIGTPVIHSTTSATVIVNWPTAALSFSILDTVSGEYAVLTSTSSSMASIVSSPSTVTDGATSVTLTITGTNTTFTTPSQFVLTGAGGTGSPPAGASIVGTPVINSTTSATVVINAPTAASTFAIKDSTSGAFAALLSTGPATPTIVATPPVQLAGSTSVTLTITGANTDFTTPSQFSIEGVGGIGGAPAGASIVGTPVIISTTSATLVINWPTGVVSFSILDIVSGAYTPLTSIAAIGTVLTAPLVVSLTDKFAAICLAANVPPVGTTTTHTSLGIGGKSFLGLANRESAADYGAHYKAAQLTDLMVSSGDLQTESALVAAAYALENALAWELILSPSLQAFLNNLNAAAALSGITGVTSLDSFASYFNTGVGGIFVCQFAPDFQKIYNLIFPGAHLTPANVYSPPVANFGTLVIGTGFTAGAGVNTSLYGGVNNCQITATGVTGTGLVTVTGLNQSGAAARNWTATVTAAGVFALTPVVPTDLLQSVTGIAAAVGLTAGTLVVNGLTPAGRTSPPT